MSSQLFNARTDSRFYEATYCICLFFVQFKHQVLGQVLFLSTNVTENIQRILSMKRYDVKYE